MTEKQSNSIMKNPTGKRAVAALRKFAEIESQYKELEAEAKEAYATLQQAMVDNDIQKIQLDEATGLKGHITLVEKSTYSIDTEFEGEIDEKYLKSALDTKKVSASVTLLGELPAGIIEKKSTYLNKKIEIL